MKKETQSPKKYPEPEEKITKLEEPAAAYGNLRYSYVDYLSWADDKMRELLNGIGWFIPRIKPLRFFFYKRMENMIPAQLTN